MNRPRQHRTGPVATRAVWDGAALLEAMGSATAYLTSARDEVNALNVFPVPDGDTGTNMAMTMRSALDAGRKLPAPDNGRVSEVANRLAFGALMGARGNSGVILSQIFRGFATAVAHLDEIDGRDFARALAGASAMAYKAVMKPVEGTMLSVIRGAASSAERATARTPSLPAALDAAVTGASEALAFTPEQLPILKQAGVVDAGGRGVVLILRALRDYARGEDHATETAEGAGAPLGASMAFLDKVDELHEADVFGYCTNFMVFGQGIDFDRVREEIAARGTSAVIVGDDTMVKVHIHTEHPGDVLEYALGLGSLDQIKIDNMNLQTETLEEERAGARAAANGQVATTPAPRETKQVILAVASGEGVSEALRSMGATAIVPGGQTMNPSTEEMLAAVKEADADDVLLLPNNKNILLAAQQVPLLTDKQVRIVPTRSIAQGLASLAAYNDEASLDANLEAMTGAAQQVTTIELTRAVRDVVLQGVDVRSGQMIGLLDEELVAAGDDERDVLRQTVGHGDVSRAELVTVFRGEGVGDEETEGVRAVLAELMPDAEVEFHPGDQPHYRFIISVE